jgi:hypothetical protein
LRTPELRAQLRVSFLKNSNLGIDFLSRLKDFSNGTKFLELLDFKSRWAVKGAHISKAV